MIDFICFAIPASATSLSLAYENWHLEYSLTMSSQISYRVLSTGKYWSLCHDEPSHNSSLLRDTESPRSKSYGEGNLLGKLSHRDFLRHSQKISCRLKCTTLGDNTRSWKTQPPSLRGERLTSAIHIPLSIDVHSEILGRAFICKWTLTWA